MPHDPAPLTEAEREFLQELDRVAQANSNGAPLQYHIDRTEAVAAVVDALAARGFVTVGDIVRPIVRISDAGRSALIEAAVAERFAKLDALLGCVARTDADEAILRLAAIARDQERRLMRLEQQRGGGA